MAKISDKIIRGNIKIISSKGITVNARSDIQDVILYAPRIEIESNFTGTLQLFAKDTIMIGEGVSLEVSFTGSHYRTGK